MFIKKYKKLLIGIIVTSLFLIFIKSLIPEPLFNKSFSKVLYSDDGKLLSLKIAGDEQWRFAASKDIPEKFKKSLICFEDEYFYYHLGFNPISIFKAFWANITKGETVRGASTLSMQCIRLSRNKHRTYWEKFKEIFLAISLELNYSKSEILNFYATHAPFGGNIVGLESASWRYFNCSPEQLSWAESACLAVLPNSPALIHPGRNRSQLLKKRDFLLKKLLSKKVIDSSTFKLAILEEIPQKPSPFNKLAPHLLLNETKNNKEHSIKTTINIDLQKQVNKIINRRMSRLEENQIHNCAVLITEVKTKKVITYIGNYQHSQESKHVDNINTNRSVGSVLKPLLYASMMDKGKILPKTLIKDVPININGFAPKNYSRKNEGAVHADQVISKSLNVPSVIMLRDYGMENFHKLITQLDVKNLFDYKHYGLGLILGGIETSVWNISKIYTNLAHQLKYNDKLFHNISYKQEENPLLNCYQFSKSSLWFMFKAMENLKRPNGEQGWKNYSHSSRIAWKTGTSFGFRDAWAVGTNAKYVVTVWVGNSNTVARPLLTGSLASAPIMFDIFSSLDNGKWFPKPQQDMDAAYICRESGYKAGPNCTHIDTVDIPKAGKHSRLCPFHKLIHLDKQELYRVNSSCYSPSKTVAKKYFVLPPVMEWFYMKTNSTYQKLPPIHPRCRKDETIMEFIYPKHKAKLYIPIDLDNKKSKSTFEVAHRNPNAEIHWHLDHAYIGSTKDFHQMDIVAPKGKHKLILIDNEANQINKDFEIVN
jgi:penicillin-binding protein 1C